MKFGYRTIAAMLIVAGCSGNEPLPSAEIENEAPLTRDEFIAQGAELIGTPDLIEGESVSVSFPAGRATYTADGRKIWLSNGGDTIMRRWQRRADGVICEELVGNGQNICLGESGAPQRGLYQLDDVIFFFDDEGNAEFRLVPLADGNFRAERV